MWNLLKNKGQNNSLIYRNKKLIQIDLHNSRTLMNKQFSKI